ncbi:hypothetical protein [Tabrizicola soli]|uniref:hypothetical protein n=1 Tax=Tabrizicola soli TaxID=2185115 RepID=UPI0036D7CADD
MKARRRTVRHHPNLGNQTPQKLRRLRLHVRLVQGFSKRRDLLAVEIREAGMKPQGRGLGAIRKEGRQLGLVLLQRGHRLLH